MSTKVAGLSMKAVTPQVLAAVAESMVAKLHVAVDAVKVSEQAAKATVPDWTAMVDTMNNCAEWKAMMHRHAHELLEANEQFGCGAVMAGVAMAVVWGFEVALAMTESADLESLLN